MKALVCEMCESNNIVKQDGFFVCQHCGTKYSVEEAKKLMIEGTVDVSGSKVSIDNTDEINNLYELARREKNAKNYRASAKHYEMISEKDPYSWEAYFYTVYCMACTSSNGEAQEMGNKVHDCTKITFELIKDHINDSDERIRAVRDVWASIKELTDRIQNNIPYIQDNGLRVNLKVAVLLMKNSVSRFLLDTFVSDDVVMKNVGIDILKQTIETGVMDAKAVEKYSDIIRKYEPSYVSPSKIETIDSKSSSNSGGCYVATSVYGSYDCPEVWTLRRYRDYGLAKTWYGRLFIYIYYAVSPLLVRWFGDKRWFKEMWRSMLDKMVVKLRNAGYKSTPYQDRDWKEEIGKG